MFTNQASAQLLGYAATPQSAFPSETLGSPSQPGIADDEGDGSSTVLPEQLRRAVVVFNSREAPGTVVIDTGHTALYYVLGDNRAIRYGVGVCGWR